MLAVLATTFPFFALVLCGWLAAERGWLADNAIPGLNGFVLYFALPCLLFRFGRDTPLLQLLNPALLGVYLAAALLIVGLTLALTLKPPVGMKDAALGALVAAFPNTGFMGVPLIVALLGSHAAGVVISTILADLLVTSSACIALAQAGTRLRAERAAFVQAVKAAASNPLPWAIAAGAGCGALDLALPGPLDQAVAMLAAAASPVALFTIGAVLSRSGRANHAAGRATPLAHYLPVALIKLLLHPGLVFGLGTVVRWLGAPLSQDQLIALTLAAALPSASNVSLLAERYGADSGRIARIILASTALAFLTFSGLASWLIPPAAG
ncbi:AEC family transporter [Roseateles sp. DC23W]|uniref:AEC family transporter n=1 Tax=Pelomonas dachongensis TaxID=3299029 RepID=A0ABW7EHZ6_9BURK